MVGLDRDVTIINDDVELSQSIYDGIALSLDDRPPSLDVGQLAGSIGYRPLLTIVVELQQTTADCIVAGVRLNHEGSIVPRSREHLAAAELLLQTVERNRLLLSKLDFAGLRPFVSSVSGCAISEKKGMNAL